MGVEPATITNWEKGNRFPKDDVLIKIADYFDCSLDYLLGRTDDLLRDICSERFSSTYFCVLLKNSKLPILSFFL